MIPSCGTRRRAVARGASMSIGCAGSGASLVTRVRPGSIALGEEGAGVVRVVHEHGRAGGRPQDAGAGHLAPRDGVDQRRLAGAGGAADDGEQRGVEPAQPGQQVVVELAEQRLALGAGVLDVRHLERQREARDLGAQALGGAEQVALLVLVPLGRGVGGGEVGGGRDTGRCRHPASAARHRRVVLVARSALLRRSGPVRRSGDGGRLRASWRGGGGRHGAAVDHGVRVRFHPDLLRPGGAPCHNLGQSLP